MKGFRKIKRLLPAIMCMWIALLSGCGLFMEKMEKVADPYSKKFACSSPDGFKCLDLAETYAKDREIENGREHTGGLAMGSVPPSVDASVSAGVGEGYDPDLVKTMIDIVIKAEDSEYAAEELAAYIRGNEQFPQMAAELLRSKAESYVQCIEAAEETNEKMLKRAGRGHVEFNRADAFANLHQCTSHIFDVPGMTRYRSASIGEELEIQREMTLRKGMARNMMNNGMPVRIPAKVVRIMVTAYEDSGGIFNGPHHIYTTVGKDRWVLATPNGRKAGGFFDALQ